MKNNKDADFIPILVDFIPLVIFMITNKFYGIIVATAVLVVLTPIAAFLAYYFKKEIPYVPIVVSIFVAIFGGLTIYFHDDIFIKIKPTIINLVFSAALFVSGIMNKNLLKMIFGKNLKLPDAIWRKLSFIWAIYFLVLAAINEFVWRNFSTTFWVNFKVFGFTPITIIFLMGLLSWLYPHIKKKV